MSLTVKREKQIKKEGVKRTKVPLIRIGVSDKPRPHNCQFEPIRKLLLVRDNVTKRDRAATAMEKALKTVYDIHRQSLLETSLKESKFKNLYERLTEKYKKLQRDHEVLFEQNKHLQEAAFNKQNRDGDCCAALRSSLATIGSSYKHLIDEKDARIKQLEDEVRKYKRRSASLGIGSIDFTQAIPSPSSRRAASHSPLRLNQETSPDSTSRGGNNETGTYQTPQKTDTINNLESHALTGSQSQNNDDGEEDLLLVDKSETATHQPKLRLHKGKLKRSRYSEEISPENKRQRQSSSPKSYTAETSRTGTISNSKTSTSNDIARPVLVPDTCQHNLNETMLKLDDNFLRSAEKDNTKVNGTNKNAKKNSQMKGKNDGGFPGIQVVPETLAAFTEMDYSDAENDIVDVDNVDGKPNATDTPNKSMDVVSDTDESGDDISQCTVKERNKKITELSMRSVLRTSDSQMNKPNLGEDEAEISIRARKKKVREKSDDTDMENISTLDTSTRNILDSPQSQSFTLRDDNDDVGEFINHKTLNLSGESEVFELDNDNEEKDENYEKIDKISLGESGDESSGFKSDIALNGKSRKDKVLEESQEGLRRSPRKLKKVQYYRSPKKSKKKLKESSQLTESEIHEMFSSPGSADEGDMTVQPTTPVVRDDKGGTLETQSMDCFNIVPVKDGVPISVKKFQLKVPKNKRRAEKNQNLGSGNEAHLENNDTHDNDRLSVDNMQSVDLKSPSIIANKPIVIEKTPELHIVLSSPSVGSLTDPESPLLLQQNKGKSKKSGKTTDDRKSSWLKSGNKSIDEDITVKGTINENDMKKKTNSPVCTIKSSRIKPVKGLCQTTLTQSFLRSPPRKGQRSKEKVKDDVDHDLEEAIRLSLEEAANSQPEDEQLNDADIEVLDFGTEKENSPPFKRPRNIPRASLRRRIKSANTDYNKGNVPNPETNINGGVLKEVPVTDNIPVGQRFGSEEAGLNGSVDPAVEITALCAESGSLETLPSLDKDFHFEDLHHGSSHPKTSTLAEEDSQEIASSSRSVTFGTKKKKKHIKTTNSSEGEGIQQVKPTEVGLSFDTSFDHVPKKKKSPEIAHVAVVRKRDERQKLKGHSCRECYEYYKSKGLPEEEIHKQIQDCSRHRAKHMKPDTPPHFWSVGFIDTQECVDRGYMQIENKEKEAKSYRRRVPYNKNFKAKNEVSLVDSDPSDLED